MPYPEQLVAPMRAELTSIGVKELKSAAEVDAFMAEKKGSAMIIINSVCGCAAGGCRPAVRLALQNSVKPDRVATVFAGQDTEATQRVRSYFSDIPPSSPSIALLKDGELVDFVPRHAIEGRDPKTIAGDLTKAFQEYFTAAK
ncbi:MAG TPA: BrxA/BrxB family bacilliredoxin [Planctomycetota bacterium]|nr:BrxA/BrxB family bacilliredoxin [Planctomycetota bacterium]